MSALGQGRQEGCPTPRMYISHQNAGVTQHDAVRAQIYVRTRAEGGRVKPITNKYIQTMFMDTWDLAACIMLPEGLNLVMPGESLETDIILRTPDGRPQRSKVFHSRRQEHHH